MLLSSPTLGRRDRARPHRVVAGMVPRHDRRRPARL
jgi:hypothetical protein